MQTLSKAQVNTLTEKIPQLVQILQDYLALRNQQKCYFKTRNTAYLDNCKSREKLLDYEVKTLLESVLLADTQELPF